MYLVILHAPSNSIHTHTHKLYTPSVYVGLKKKNCAHSNLVQSCWHDIYLIVNGEFLRPTSYNPYTVYKHSLCIRFSSEPPHPL